MTKRQSAWIIISFRTFRKCAVILDTWRQLLLDNVPCWNLLNGFEDSLWRYPYVFNYVVTALSTIASAPLLFAVFNSPEEKFFCGRFFFLYLKFCPPVMREGEQNTFLGLKGERAAEMTFHAEFYSDSTLVIRVKGEGESFWCLANTIGGNLCVLQYTITVLSCSPVVPISQNAEVQGT